MPDETLLDGRLAATGLERRRQGEPGPGRRVARMKAVARRPGGRRRGRRAAVARGGEGERPDVPARGQRGRPSGAACLRAGARPSGGEPAKDRSRSTRPAVAPKARPDPLARPAPAASSEHDASRRPRKENDVTPSEPKVHATH